ncbi:MAG: biotin/lipoyl-binding protein [Oscillospiraceae bacterium]|nr:biotin/lipoyl-binding protein [Oscillospiraceae bacterium]
MKKYNVTVNGTAYEIVLEVADAADVKATAPAAPAAATPAAAPAAPVAAGGETVTSPMPGTILNVVATNGAAVKKGDVLMVLEAMKMENEIMAPCDGTVASVNVTKGATVDTGAVLCVIA